MMMVLGDSHVEYLIEVQQGNIRFSIIFQKYKNITGPVDQEVAERVSLLGLTVIHGSLVLLTKGGEKILTEESEAWA